MRQSLVGPSGGHQTVRQTIFNQSTGRAATLRACVNKITSFCQYSRSWLLASLLKYMWNLDGRTQGRPISAHSLHGLRGPYSLCAKCHDLNNIVSNASFSKHALHINAGFSCSACHTAHGMAAKCIECLGRTHGQFRLKGCGRERHFELFTLPYFLQSKALIPVLSPATT